MALELFIDKKFSAAHRQVIKQANAIIEEYEAAGYRLTLRQLHYQFVARDLYENTQANYKRLGNIMDAARKAGRVDWDSIEDRTRSLERIGVWNNPESALEILQEQFKLDPWDEQPIKRRIEVWVEKDAAVGIVAPTCDDLRLAYFSCRGYSSSSGLYEAGKRLAWYRDHGYETEIIYFGDHDPSGVQMTDVAENRVNLYGHGVIGFTRIALTLDQVAEYNPPPNWVKETDSRTEWYVEQFNTQECWELDALSPQVVDGLIRGHVDPKIDKAAWEKTMKTEEEHKDVLQEIISDWGRTKAAPDMLDKLREFATELTVEGKTIPEEDVTAYEEVDSATLASVIDGSTELLSKHNLL